MAAPSRAYRGPESVASRLLVQFPVIIGGICLAVFEIPLLLRPPGQPAAAAGNDIKEVSEIAVQKIVA